MKTLEQNGDVAPNFEGCESPAQQIALLESMVAEMHQDMQEKDRTIEQLQYAVVEMEHQMAATPVRGGGGGGVERGAAAEHIASLEAKLSQLRAANGDQDHHIGQLEEALVSAERALHNKAGDAEERAQYLEAVVSEKENKVAQLQASLDALSQGSPAQAQERSLDADRNLERALEAEERSLQLAAVVEEKAHIISRIEAELVQLQQTAAVAGDNSAQARIAAEAEAKAHHLQVLVDAKDQQITQLEHLLHGMQEQSSRTRAAALRQDEGQQMRALLEQKDEEIRKLSEDMAGVAKRAEIAEAGRRDLRKELASSTEEVVRLQVALDGKDVHMAQLFEDEKRSSGAHKQVIEAEVARLQTFIAEKDRLIEQLMAAVATNKAESGNAEVAQLTQSFEQEVLQLTKSFEEERAALRSQMTQQFEQEYSALRGQVKRLQFEAEAAVTEREATSTELRQVVAQYEQRLLAASLPEAATGPAGGFADAPERLGRAASAQLVGLPPGAAYATTAVEVSSARPQMPEGPTIMQRPPMVEVRPPPQQQQGFPAFPQPQTPRTVFRASYTAPSPISRRPGMPGGAEMYAAPPPASAMRAASPPRDLRDMRAASPPPGMRAASPVTLHRAMSQAGPQLPFAAPVPVQMQVPLQLPQTQRAASPIAGAPAGGSVTLPSRRQNGSFVAAQPGGSIIVGQGGSVAIAHGGSMAVLPGGSASMPPGGGSLAASQRAFAVASPPRVRPPLVEDGVGPQRQASPLHMQPVVSHPVPAWAMQQPQQPPVDGTSKYLLPASAMTARPTPGESGIPPVAMARVVSAGPGALRPVQGTSMAMDLGRDVGMMQEQPQGVYFIPRPEIIGAEGAYLDAPYSGMSARPLFGKPAGISLSEPPGVATLESRMEQEAVGVPSSRRAPGEL